VLLTRARKRLDFYASIQHADFNMSDNESVELLRRWFAELESKTQSNENLTLPISVNFLREENNLTILEPHVHLQQAEEFVTFQSVMEARGWRLHYS
ncbi:MAG: hypothetical protein MK066_15255, partial [Crocinitomicaceae bacterium]|nr:hypothetical protein [Crocinitomicaceae bacterium]